MINSKKTDKWIYLLIVIPIVAILVGKTTFNEKKSGTELKDHSSVDYLVLNHAKEALPSYNPSIQSSTDNEVTFSERPMSSAAIGVAKDTHYLTSDYFSRGYIAEPNPGFDGGTRLKYVINR